MSWRSKPQESKTTPGIATGTPLPLDLSWPELICAPSRSSWATGRSRSVTASGHRSYARECESGGIGRRTRLRIWRGNPWGFESPLSHHNVPGTGSKEEAGRQDRPFQCPQVSHDAQYSVAVFTVKIAWGLQLQPDGASQLRMLLIPSACHTVGRYSLLKYPFSLPQCYDPRVFWSMLIYVYTGPVTSSSSHTSLCCCFQ